MHLTNESGLGRALEKFRPLRNKRIALLEGNGLDLDRMATLRDAFELAGAEVTLISPTVGLLQAGNGSTLSPDLRLNATVPDVYHALCIPGSASAVAALRASEE